jgi:hypothetical protein
MRQAVCILACRQVKRAIRARRPAAPGSIPDPLGSAIARAHWRVSGLIFSLHLAHLFLRRQTPIPLSKMRAQCETLRLVFRVQQQPRADEGEAAQPPIQLLF